MGDGRDLIFLMIGGEAAETDRLKNNDPYFHHRLDLFLLDYFYLIMYLFHEQGLCKENNGDEKIMVVRTLIPYFHSVSAGQMGCKSEGAVHSMGCQVRRSGF